MSSDSPQSVDATESFQRLAHRSGLVCSSCVLLLTLGLAAIAWLPEEPSWIELPASVAGIVATVTAALCVTASIIAARGPKRQWPGFGRGIVRLLKRPIVRGLLVGYGVFWLLTMTLGNYQTNQAFDREFQYGYEDFSGDRFEIPRIDSLVVEDLRDPRNRDLIPEEYRFRYRSRGIAVAPFLIVDEIGVVFASMGGIGARRVNLWFFGFSKWWPVKHYWSV